MVVSPPCQHGSHDDVGGTRHRSLVQQHVGSAQTVRAEGEIVVVEIVIELRTEFLKPYQVGIQPPAPYLVAARFGQIGDAETGQQGPDDHDRTAQPGASTAVILRTDIIEVDVAGTERVALRPRLLHLDPHGTQHIHELQNIHYLRNVVQRHPFGGKERGTNYLEGFVLGPLRYYLSLQAVSALHDEFSHISKFLYPECNAIRRRKIYNLRGMKKLSRYRTTFNAVIRQRLVK